MLINIVCFFDLKQLPLCPKIHRNLQIYLHCDPKQGIQDKIKSNEYPKKQKINNKFQDNKNIEKRKECKMDDYNNEE